jgi:hypothetical protein
MTKKGREDGKRSEMEEGEDVLADHQPRGQPYSTNSTSPQEHKNEFFWF